MLKIYSSLLLVFLSFFIHAQNFTISGFIDDQASREKLIGASIFEVNSKTGIITNTYGFYSISLPRDSVKLICSYVGCDPQVFNFYLDKDVKLNIHLGERKELKEVEIVEKKIKRIEDQVQMSQVIVPIDQIKKIPSLLGETDILKVLQLLPGVQSGGEGQSGIYVRGGSPDQNLILLDGVPVYNASHLLGFFSVFNPDAIKNVTLTKGGFPARYGGRLSSVIDINMKEGDMQDFHCEGSVGIVASKLTFEGPIKKDKTSFIVSARRTYIDFLVRPLVKAASDPGVSTTPTLFFYDLNAKVNHIINDRHRIFISAYLGKDKFGIKYSEKYNNETDKLDAGTDWGNFTTAFRWNYLINKKMFANFTGTYSQYGINFLTAFESQLGSDYSRIGSTYHSGIFDWGAKADFEFFPNPHHYIRFGGGSTYHTYDPGAITLQFKDPGFDLDTMLGSDRTFAFEPYLYFEDEITLGAFRANLGLHTSAFHVNHVWYKSLQPRIALSYQLPANIALKGSFCTMTQYINLLTSEALSLPSDLWVPSTSRIKPQKSWQAALGLAKTIYQDYEFSIEGYYKKMDNVISYKEGAGFLGLKRDWQDKVTQGKGHAYGLEFFIQKKEGKTTGWIAYTLAWNFRQFNDVNSGIQFPFRYDRRHDISIVVNHEFSKKFNMSGTWVYGTGNAISLPISDFRFPYNLDNTNSEIIYPSDATISGTKNSFRMNPYHRLDLAFNFVVHKKISTRTWSLGAYNTYNRKNPYFIYRDFSSNSNTTTVYKQVSLFPIIPYLSYSWKF